MFDPTDPYYITPEQEELEEQRTLDERCLSDPIYACAKAALTDEYRTNERLSDRDFDYHCRKLAEAIQAAVEEYVNFELEKVEL